MTREERKRQLLEVFEQYEEMQVLLACLSRSPALWEEDDGDGAVQGRLLDKGLLDTEAGFSITTAEGRRALINYINGVD